MSKSKTRQSALALAEALMNDFGSRDDTQIKRLKITSESGVYQFNFAEHEFPETEGEYDVDIDVIPGAGKQAEIVDLGRNGFTFAIKSKGVHFSPQPIDCSKKPVNVNIKVTYTDGVNEE